MHRRGKFGRPRRWIRLFPTVVLATLCACTGSGGFQTHYGQQASELARHVPGCSQVKAAPDGDGSSATCRMGGHEVEFVAFADVAAGKEPMTAYAPMATAHGTTWLEYLPSTDVSLAVQQRIATAVARALGGKVLIFRGT